MASEELVNRLLERATTLWEWAGRAERTTGPSATTEQWRIDRALHDDAATEIYRLARELEATRAALRIAQTTAANLHDTIRLRDRELEEARERERAVRVAAHDDLAEIAGMLADMHDGDECRFEGGEGCLACYAQERIREMQDALAARTTGEER